MLARTVTRLPRTAPLRIAQTRVSSSAAAPAAPAAGPTAYSTTLSILHWVQVVGVGGCIGTVLTAQRTPPEEKEQKMKLMHIHKSFGKGKAVVARAHARRGRGGGIDVPIELCVGWRRGALAWQAPPWRSSFHFASQFDSQAVSQFTSLVSVRV